MELFNGSELKAVADGIQHRAQVNVGPQKEMLRASLQKCTMDAGKSSCNICILSHSVGMGRGDGQKPGDVRPASPMQAQSQQLLTHMAKDRVSNVLEGKRGKYLVLGPKKRRCFQQWAVYVDGGQGTEHLSYQLPNKAGWDLPCAVMPSHAAGFPRALARPPLSPGIRAGNVGEKFSESRRNPAAGCPRRHPGTSLPRCIDSAPWYPALSRGRPMAPAGNLNLSVEVCGLLRGQEL